MIPIGDGNVCGHLLYALQQNIETDMIPIGDGNGLRSASSFIAFIETDMIPIGDGNVLAVV